MANTIKFFDGDLDDVKIGVVSVDKVYVGDTLIWGGGGGEPVTGVQLSQTSMTIDFGTSSAITATVLPSNAGDKSVTWSTSDSNIVTVSNGVITAVDVGFATVTVTTNDGGYTAQCEVVSTMIPASNNQITYKATAKLAEVTGTGTTAGIHTQVFSGTSGQLTMTSHDWSDATKTGILTFNGTITSVGNRAFLKCSGSTSAVTSIGFPDTVTSIGSACCSGCSAMTTFYIPSNITSIGKSAFEYCRKLNLGYLVFPNSLTTIGNSAFYGCYNITNVVIPDTTTSIGTSIFYNSQSLKTAVVGSGINGAMPNGLFNSCSSLEYVEFKGTGITRFNSQTVSKNNNIAIVIRTSTPPTITESQTGTGSFPYSQNLGSNFYFYVPDSSVETYKKAMVWAAYSSRIKAISDLPT